MEISYLGHSSFRIKGKQATVITDPFDPEMVGLKFANIDADIVTISHDHADHNQAQRVTNTRRVVNGPGEYEILGVSIIGIASFHDAQKGVERGKNTIYVYEMDGLRLAHLGDLGHKLEEKQLEEMGDIDVLFVPVGGVYTINSTEAAEVTQSIEPNIIIPMHYQASGLKAETFSQLEDTENFVKQLGNPVERLSKLVLKDTISEEEQKIVILE